MQERSNYDYDYDYILISVFTPATGRAVSQRMPTSPRRPFLRRLRGSEFEPLGIYVVRSSAEASGVFRA